MVEIKWGHEDDEAGTYEDGFKVNISYEKCHEDDDDNIA